MRKINTRHFRLATRRTPRDINRQIVLNLIREHQPISRAELSRRMEVPRSALTTIVRELVDNGAVQEVGTAMAVRGRRPTLLRIRTGGRLVAAADVRPGHTRIALTDFEGRAVASESFATPRAPEELVELLADSVTRMLRAHGAVDGEPHGMSTDPFADPDGSADAAAARQIAAEPERSCIGVGLVVPGMVDRRTRKVLYAPRLGWRDVALHEAISTRLGLPVYVEGAPVACALARLWHSPEETRDVRSFAYVSVSDGIGVGLVMNGDAVRGEAHTAGEFGHVTLDPSGPACACGKKGCFEAFACNSATIARYVDGVRGPAAAANGRRTAKVASAITIEEVVRRAREGEVAAIAALEETGTHLGRGLAAVVSAFNPGRIYVGGEVTAAWDIIEGPMRRALVAETLTAAAHATPVVPDRNPAEYRLLGAVALVAAPEFAAPALG